LEVQGKPEIPGALGKICRESKGLGKHLKARKGGPRRTVRKARRAKNPEGGKAFERSRDKKEKGNTRYLQKDQRPRGGRRVKKKKHPSSASEE